MGKGLYFLSVAYQGTEEEKAYRHAISLKAAAEGLRQGIHIFAPVIYVNQIVDAMNLPTMEARRQIVMPYLLEYLRVSKGMILVTVEGWQNSWGVRQELLYCDEHKIPVYMIEPDKIEENLSLLIPIQASQVLEAA